MKRTLKIHLRDEAEIRAALAIATDSRYTDAVTLAEQRLQNARARVDEHEREIEALRFDVAAGAARPQDLEDQIRRRQVAALLVPAAERQLADARAALARAELETKQRIVRDAGKLRDELQRTADELTPVLDELRTLETTLDRAVAAAGGTQTEPVRWPQSLVDEYAVPAPPSPMPPITWR